jgi:hypothetical protein
MNLEQLIQSICQVHQEMAGQATRAVNLTITLRNWLVGWHIQEYEQHGEDRAQYGEKLIETIAARLEKAGVARCEARELRRNRLFYQVYPQIWETLSPQFHNMLPWRDLQKWETPSPSERHARKM